MELEILKSWIKSESASVGCSEVKNMDMIFDRVNTVEMAILVLKNSPYVAKQVCPRLLPAKSWTVAFRGENKMIKNLCIRGHASKRSEIPMRGASPKWFDPAGVAIPLAIVPCSGIENPQSPSFGDAPNARLH